MKIVYYTRGITGWGRVVIGISIGNALKRNDIDCDYTVISSLETDFLTDDIDHIKIPLEDENILSRENYHTSALYRTLTDLKPDVILFDLIWFATYHFINEIDCKKIFLCHQVADRFFSMDLPDQRLVFNPDHFDIILGIEPFKSIIQMDFINPIIFRNRDEIFTREEAIKRLDLDDNRPVCLFSFNRKTGDFDEFLKKYSYLEDLYRVVYAHKYRNGLFPEVDYFNAFDFIVCGGGYNQFWEVIYFNKEAVFEAIPLIFESHSRRIEECQEFYFDLNGADQLVDIIMNI